MDELDRMKEELKKEIIDYEGPDLKEEMLKDRR